MLPLKIFFTQYWAKGAKKSFSAFEVQAPEASCVERSGLRGVLLWIYPFACREARAPQVLPAKGQAVLPRLASLSVSPRLSPQPCTLPLSVPSCPSASSVLPFHLTKVNLTHASILLSKYCSPVKQTRAPRKRVDPKAGTGEVQDEPGTSSVRQ